MDYAGKQQEQKFDENRVEKIYPYQDEDGNPLFEVVRFKNPKGFAQRKPNGEWNLRGAEKGVGEKG